MANIYVGQFKDVCKMFYNQTKANIAKIEENKATYASGYVQNVNAPILEQMKTDYESAKGNINSIFLTVRGYLANATFLNSESRTADKDWFDLNSPYILTVEDVRAFAERYHNNFTMLRMISDWITRKSQEYEGKVNPFADIRINMPKDYLMAYKKFAESALSLIDSIYTEGSGFNKSALDWYADEEFGAELFAIIGNGMDLSNYKNNNRIPESVCHRFDDVVLRM